MKIGTNQILLPSGVVTSKDGKYHFWECSVSGLMTFAKPDYWVKVMAKYGSEENLVKTYVCKKAQKLLAEGLSPEEVRKVLSHPVDKKAKREIKEEKARRKAITKRTRRAGLKSFAVGKVEVAVTSATGSVEVQKVPVYPWQGNPDYFKSTIGSVSMEELTKETCLFPTRNIDDECRGCPIYDRCSLPTKYTEKDWKTGKRRREQVVVKPLNVFEE